MRSDDCNLKVAIYPTLHYATVECITRYYYANFLWSFYQELKKWKIGDSRTYEVKIWLLSLVHS